MNAGVKLAPYPVGIPPVIPYDVIFLENVTINGSLNAGPITADSLDVTGNISTTGGNLRVRNGGFIQGRNAANTAWLDLIEMRSTNRVRIPSANGAVAWEVGAAWWWLGTAGTTADQFSMGRLNVNGDGGYNVQSGAMHTFRVNNVNAFNIKAGGFQYSLATVPAVDINWNAATTHTKTISADTTFTMSNVAENQPIEVLVTNSGTHTVSWTNPAGLTIEWVGKVVPVQTHNGKDLYLFKRIGTVIIGRVIQDIG